MKTSPYAPRLAALCALLGFGALSSTAEAIPLLNGFGGPSGYGTPDHAEALRRYGPSPIHRKSYAPVRAAMAPELPFEPVA